MYRIRRERVMKKKLSVYIMSDKDNLVYCSNEHRLSRLDFLREPRNVFAVHRKFVSLVIDMTEQKT